MAYVVIILTLVNVTNFVDRQVVNIAGEFIKKEFELHDWQLGALTGLSFAITYALAGLPLARRAERSNRPLLLAGTMLVWGGLTALSGTAHNFVQLLMMRLGVGGAEAATTPTSHALIADTVPPHWRARAISAFQMGAPLGGLIGMAVGGLVLAGHGWRATLLVAGLPALALAMVVSLTIREPRELSPAVPVGQAMTMKGSVTGLLRIPAYVLLTIGSTLLAIRTYATAAFLVSFFLRNHSEGLKAISDFWAATTGVALAPVASLGLMIGILGGVSAVLGTLVGGYLSDRWAYASPRHYGTIAALPSAMAIPLLISGFLVPSAGWALVLLTLPTFLSNMSQGPVYAGVQVFVPRSHRAVAVALMQIVLTLAGLGIGPLLVGITSDLVAGQGVSSGDALRWGMLVAELPAIAGVIMLWKVRKSAGRDLSAARQADSAVEPVS